MTTVFRPVSQAPEAMATASPSLAAPIREGAMAEDKEGGVASYEQLQEAPDEERVGRPRRVEGLVDVARVRPQFVREPRRLEAHQ